MVRNVSLPTSIHNLLWHFVASLSVAGSDGDEEATGKEERKDRKEQEMVSHLKYTCIAQHFNDCVMKEYHNSFFVKDFPFLNIRQV